VQQRLKSAKIFGMTLESSNIPSDGEEMRGDERKEKDE